MFAFRLEALIKQIKSKRNTVFVMSVSLMTFDNDVLCFNEGNLSGLTCCLHTESEKHAHRIISMQTHKVKYLISRNKKVEKIAVLIN